MNIYYHVKGHGLRYEPDPLDMALCEVCGTCLATEEEADAGLCDVCADTLLYEPTEAGQAFVTEPQATA